MTDVESPRSETGPEVSLTTTGRVMSSKSEKINYFVGVCVCVHRDMSEVCKLTI